MIMKLRFEGALKHNTQVQEQITLLWKHKMVWWLRAAVEEEQEQKEQKNIAKKSKNQMEQDDEWRRIENKFSQLNR